MSSVRIHYLNQASLLVEVGAVRYTGRFE